MITQNKKIILKKELLSETQTKKDNENIRVHGRNIIFTKEKKRKMNKYDAESIQIAQITLKYNLVVSK